MDVPEIGLGRPVELIRREPENSEHLVGHRELVGSERPGPTAEVGQLLGAGQAGLTLTQGFQYAAGSQHVPDPMA